MTVIELTEISHRYAQKWALEKLSLKIDEGKIIAVLGPNGCGKTTLLKILATRLEPTCGKGIMLGYDLAKEPLQIRKKVKWLGHELGLYKALTAEENLEFFLKIGGQKILKNRIDVVLRKVGLEKNRLHKVASFSTGMKKRLSIARILLEDPKILLFDEPHANLDQEGKKLMNELILEKKKVGCTVLFATHEHPDMLAFCDQTILLNEGRLA